MSYLTESRLRSEAAAYAYNSVLDELLAMGNGELLNSAGFETVVDDDTGATWVILEKVSMLTL